MSMDIIKTLIKAKKYFFLSLVFLLKFLLRLAHTMHSYNLYLSCMALLHMKFKGRATAEGIKSEKNRKMVEITVFNFSISCC
jgi:hypothetical protein